MRCCLLRLVLLASLSACAQPQLQTRTNTTVDQARLTPTSAIMSDGYVLPLKTWPSIDEPAAVVLAVHGFNDYSNAFEATANGFARHAITTYAIDQRGFGATTQQGIWPGQVVMQSDLVTTVKLLCARHADRPVFLLGESMGAAVTLSAIQPLQHTCIKGVILSSPAVWGWQVMPWWQTLPLRLLAHTLPGVTVTGEGLDIKASDNIDMLRALGKDPLIIKETRIDTIYGLTDLMEAALVNSPALTLPALILYGEHDQIIPPESFCEMLENLPEQTLAGWRLVLYRDGYHMLSRDLQGEVVIRDMVTWIHNSKAPLPSGQEVVEGDARLGVFSECKLNSQH